MPKIQKIWGYLDNIFSNEKCKIDVLFLQKNSACSVHYHREKINRFYLIKGSVKINSDLGEKILKKNDTFDICPSTVHQFVALKDSILIEIAFVEDGLLKESDIVRKIQGGRFVNGKFFTLDELKKENWKEYKNYE